ncbi:hypothetical protein F4810DRAFT_713721 [Camillea tinctor]|nr:hypothetical protein F4810DRAFT_713721 [Camillea tinctor]
MLRHSASQVFGSKHPALTRASANDDRTPPPAWAWGISSGNSRMVTQQQQPPNFLSQAQTQAQYGEPFLAQDPMLFGPGGPMSMTTMPYRTSSTANPASSSSSSSSKEAEAKGMMAMMVITAASRHPVFFTERLHPSPFVLDAAAITSPVAHGYVYHENQRRADGAIPAMKAQWMGQIRDWKFNDASPLRRFVRERRNEPPGIEMLAHNSNEKG